jgi:hypothetical protein
LNEKEKLLDILFDRIATALEANEIPTVEDSVTLESIILNHWQGHFSSKDLGLRTRVDKRVKVERLDKEELQSIVNHLVQQKKPSNAKSFTALIRGYLNKEITAFDLLHERDRKLRNDLNWVHYDQLGEIAEHIKINVAQSLHTGNASFSKGNISNLYNFLSDLSKPLVNIKDVKEKYRLPASCQLTRIETGFYSPTQWRNSHLEYKKHQ